MKRALVITGVVLLVLVAVLGGAYLWLSRPVALESFDEPGPSMATKQQNSFAQTVLLADGIESSLVDITAERIYVAYDAPALDAETTAEDIQTDVLFSAAEAAPGSERAVIVMYVDGVAKLIWKADLGDLRALAEEDEDGLEAYLAGVEKTVL